MNNTWVCQIVASIWSCIAGQNIWEPGDKKHENPYSGFQKLLDFADFLRNRKLLAIIDITI